VSNAKRTPDESGRGSVATGQQPVEPAGGNGSAVGTARQGAGTDNGRAVERSGAHLATSDGAADPERATPGPTGSDAVASGRSTTGGAAKRADGALPAARPDETATAQFRLPTPGESGRSGEKTATGAGRAVDATSADGRRVPPGTTAPAAGAAAAPPASTAARPPAPAETGRPTLDPVPAPAVPAPGPGAAQPPPWRRMPGHDAGRPERVSAADRLLDDGPTAFLETPRYAPSGPGGEAVGTDTGSWTRIPRTRPPRQAALQLKRLDPWSVLKLALVLAVVLFFIWLVAVGVLYGVLDGMGVWDRLNGTYADLVSGESQTGNTLISAGRVFGLAAVVGAINSLLFAVAVTVGAFVYNVSADLVGGIEVTLSERD
jgi:hypothetical protein